MAYFDNNATTPLGPEVLQIMNDALSKDWANPSSPYRRSAKIRARMKLARSEMARSLSVNPDFLTFTSGATEANNAVFAGIASRSRPDSRILISSIEHPSISIPANYHFSNRIDLLPVDAGGVVSTDFLSEYLSKNRKPALVSLMAASNETGVLQPWLEAAQICHDCGVHFHCDSTQWIGKLKAEQFSACSTFVASGHKFGSPKGIGLLAGNEPFPFLLGGEQEAGRRGGTENYPAIEGMREAWKRYDKLAPILPKRSIWRDAFEASLDKHVPGIRILGIQSPRLWNTSTFIIPEFENIRWVGKLDKLGFEVSTGSACSTGTDLGTPTASAFKLTREEASRLIRVSSYVEQNEDDWKSLNQAFLEAHTELSSVSIISL